MRVIVDARSLNEDDIGPVILSILENLDYNRHQYALIGDRSLLTPLKLPVKVIHNKSNPNSLMNYYDPSLAKLINDYDCYITFNDVIPLGIHINSYCVFNNLSCLNKKGNRLKGFLKKILLRRSYHIAKKIFVFSDYVKAQVEKYFGKKKEVIKLSYNLSNLFKEHSDKLTNLNHSNYYVYTGNVSKDDNFQILLKTLKEISDQSPLHVISLKHRQTSLEKRFLKKLAKKSYIKVYKNLSLDEYIREIKGARALINLSSNASVGINIIEAASCHTPIILSDDNPVYQENYQKFDAYFVNPQEPNKLKEILSLKMLNASKIPESFNREHDVKNSINIIEDTFIKTPVRIQTKRNFVFNVIYQLLVVLTPLITAPYVARVLGANNIGKFAFTYTIICYFVIFAALGFEQYAQRAIAEVQKDKEEQSRVFWQIVILRFITVGASFLILMILYLTNVFGDYSYYILLFSILVIACAFDINFYFHGKENFFVVMIINLFIRLTYLILVFTLVKSMDDLWIYILLYSLMVAGGYLSMWALLPANLRRVKIKTLNTKKHFKSSFALFIPVAAVSIYALIDKTLIGSLIHGQQYVMDSSGAFVRVALISEVENGYYFQAERIVRALLSILFAFGMVMTTRNAIEYSNQRHGAVKKNIYHSFQFVFAFGIPMALGTLLVARSFTPLYFGKYYDFYTNYTCDGVSNLLMLYSPIILLSGISNILGTQYLLTTKQDKKYALSVGVGFVFNLLLSVIFIPLMGAAGAIVGTLISEFIIILIQYFFIRKDLSLRLIIMCVWKYLIAGGIMFGILYTLNSFVLSNVIASNLLTLIILIPSGIAIYYLTLLCFKDHYALRYTKSSFVVIGHTLRSMTNKVLVQSVSFFLTIKSHRHLTSREIPNISKEDDHENE